MEYFERLILWSSRDRCSDTNYIATGQLRLRAIGLPYSYSIKLFCVPITRSKSMNSMNSLQSLLLAPSKRNRIALK